RYKPEDVWAFQPVVKPKLDLKPNENAIDHLIREKLAAAKVEPAPSADARALIRRISFDLTGLPPTPKEVEAFVKAHAGNAASAIAELTDRLLASPHYGERWAQHWLDVARYADTGGMSNDYERSNAWRYRDYVIRAFNDDKPYDQFVMEQIAGDELAANQKQGTKNSELLTATGFLRMGPWDPAM
ncbi:MAG: DUF1549 domain-containing protein, partial [Verrucomicrobiales bacterium]|nr:DUF1549 domain-containing protein [Verrucomicrobiales bacterium]